MPFLRVVRDKRGYETTYLIHSFKEGPHPGSRVLYAFRSPGGVRVGRNPFDQSVRREIERSNPDLAFDWDTLVSGQQVIDSTPDPRRQRRRSGSAPGAPPGASAGTSRSESRPSPPRRAEPPPQAPRLTVPTVIEGDTPETRMRFLANWHGILCEQLPERVTDPARLEALMAVAQRLNPAGWLDADEISAGIEGATEALERLSRMLSKRRRKPRKSGQRDASSPADAPADDASRSDMAQEADDEVGEIADEEPEAPQTDVAADDDPESV
ncbi:MAG: hypothetical protein ABL986_16945 [Vicinamibacterales bacterium]